MRAARALAERIPGLRLGRFYLASRCRSPQGSAAARPTPPRPCARWPPRTASRRTMSGTAGRRRRRRRRARLPRPARAADEGRGDASARRWVSPPCSPCSSIRASRSRRRKFSPGSGLRAAQRPRPRSRARNRPRWKCSPRLKRAATICSQAPRRSRRKSARPSICWSEPAVRLARMSGSGATCFALFPDRHAAAGAARALKNARPGWWVRATYLR